MSSLPLQDQGLSTARMLELSQMHMCVCMSMPHTARGRTTQLNGPSRGKRHKDKRKQQTGTKDNAANATTTADTLSFLTSKPQTVGRTGAQNGMSWALLHLQGNLKPHESASASFCAAVKSFVEILKSHSPEYVSGPMHSPPMLVQPSGQDASKFSLQVARHGHSNPHTEASSSFWEIDMTLNLYEGKH